MNRWFATARSTVGDQRWTKLVAFNVNNGTGWPTCAHHRKLRATVGQALEVAVGWRETCNRRAAQCEERAEQATDHQLQATLRWLADQWRELASLPENRIPYF